MSSKLAGPAPVPKIGFVSLGCPKALVDSERIITRLRSEGYALSPDYAGADVVVVNTCGFIDSAKEESLGAISEALKENGRVVVTGCLGVESAELMQRFPGLLAVTGPHQYEAVMEAVHEAAPRPHDPFLDLVPESGIRLTPRHYAYLKISEGCNHTCSFCIIPHLRGKLASRPIGDVMREAERLARAGVKEIMVISQDTSAYGVDLRYATGAWRGRDLPARFDVLAEALGELGIWVRLHYVYPYPHVDAIVPLMRESGLLPYLDIPFQHASPRVLKAMRRPAAQEKTLDRIRAWRTIRPDLAIRSTFIVGFPGETEEDFQQLLDWLDEAEIDRIGCFRYEPVRGAAANDLPDAVPSEVKDERYARLMAHSQSISTKLLARRIGLTTKALIDEVAKEGAVGRTVWDAPEIDGQIFIDGATHLAPGDVVTVEIEDADEYDLWGRLTGPDACFPKKPAPDLIRSGHRFSDKVMRKQELTTKAQSPSGVRAGRMRLQRA